MSTDAPLLLRCWSTPLECLPLLERCPQVVPTYGYQRGDAVGVLCQQLYHCLELLPSYSSTAILTRCIAAQTATMSIMGLDYKHPNGTASRQSQATPWIRVHEVNAHPARAKASSPCLVWERSGQQTCFPQAGQLFPAGGTTVSRGRDGSFPRAGQEFPASETEVSRGRDTPQ